MNTAQSITCKWKSGFCDFFNKQVRNVRALTCLAVLTVLPACAEPVEPGDSFIAEDGERIVIREGGAFDIRRSRGGAASGTYTINGSTILFSVRMLGIERSFDGTVDGEVLTLEFDGKPAQYFNEAGATVARMREEALAKEAKAKAEAERIAKQPCPNRKSLGDIAVHGVKIGMCRRDAQYFLRQQGRYTTQEDGTLAMRKADRNNRTTVRFEIGFSEDDYVDTVRYVDKSRRSRLSFARFPKATERFEMQNGGKVAIWESKTSLGPATFFYTTFPKDRELIWTTREDIREKLKEQIDERR